MTAQTQWPIPDDVWNILLPYIQRLQDRKNKLLESRERLRVAAKFSEYANHQLWSLIHDHMPELPENISLSLNRKKRILEKEECDDCPDCDIQKPHFMTFMEALTKAMKNEEKNDGEENKS